MKFTLDQIKAIIAEEVQAVIAEAWRPGDDPALRPGSADVGMSPKEKWAEKGDIPFEPSSAKSDEMPKDLSVEGQEILAFLKKVFGDHIRLADFDKEHAKAIRMAIKNPEDKNREHLETLIQNVQAKQKEGMKPYDEGDLMVRLTTLMKYGLPRSYKSN